MTGELKPDQIKHPICPLYMYFEGDEDKIQREDCDFNLETRSCSTGCINTKELEEKMFKIMGVDEKVRFLETNRADLRKKLLEAQRFCTDTIKIKGKVKVRYTLNDGIVVELEEEPENLYALQMIMVGRCSLCWSEKEREYAVKSEVVSPIEIDLTVEG